MTKIPRNLLDGWQIIVLDDDADSLQVAELILKRYGATVYTAVNGAEGLEILETVTPNLMICDISMPVMDGWDFIDEVKKNHELAEIPIIALTAHTLTENRTRAMEVGFNTYMTKPFTVNTFIVDLVKLMIDMPTFHKFLSGLSLDD